MTVTPDRIETRRLILRPPQTKDAQPLARYIGEWDTARMLARVPYPYTVATARHWITLQTRDCVTEHALIMEYKGVLVGGIGLHRPGLPEAGTGASGCRELGYWVARPWRGRGLASEAVAAMIAFGFSRAGCHRLIAGYFADNRASARILIKCGFRYYRTGMRWCEARAARSRHFTMVLRRPSREQRQALR